MSYATVGRSQKSYLHHRHESGARDSRLLTCEKYGTGLVSTHDHIYFTFRLGHGPAAETVRQSAVDESLCRILSHQLHVLFN